MNGKRDQFFPFFIEKGDASLLWLLRKTVIGLLEPDIFVFRAPDFEQIYFFYSLEMLCVQRREAGILRNSGSRDENVSEFDQCVFPLQRLIYYR